MRLKARDGVEIATERFGDDAAPAVVFAHGFGQTRRAWTSTARAVAANGWQAITADARGHGDSGWRDDGHYDFAQFVDDLVLVTNQFEKPVLIGASMGGLLGLVAQAQFRPFGALVLVDITPRWESAGIERIIGFMRAHPSGFASVDDAASAVADYLPHRAAGKSPERLRESLVRGDDGRWRWHWDPRMLDSIVDDSERYQSMLLDAARRIDVPTLLISGEKSDIVSDATIAEFLQLVPHAEHVRVPRATHMVAGDENDAFSSAVLGFLGKFHSPVIAAKAL
ncbi:MAG TPA: alpha/beta hydrolase [Rudaea sp.]|jgi:pimeloyl-ACP methyl ester carboxylesterase|nr:alpha/beta hydrolase [Rudaea sp.]